MSPLDVAELDFDSLELPDISDIELADVTDIQIPDIDLDFSEMEMELAALNAEPIDFPEIDLDSPEFDLMNDPETVRMFQECEKELAALTAEDEPDSPAPIVTEVRADRRKAERQHNERKRKKQGSSKAAD